MPTKENHDIKAVVSSMITSLLMYATILNANQQKNAKMMMLNMIFAMIIIIVLYPPVFGYHQLLPNLAYHQSYGVRLEPLRWCDCHQCL